KLGRDAGHGHRFVRAFAKETRQIALETRADGQHSHQTDGQSCNLYSALRIDDEKITRDREGAANRSVARIGIPQPGEDHSKQSQVSPPLPSLPRHSAPME